MIHWLIQSITAHPDLAHGQAPPGLLSKAETTIFNGFSVRKRRQDWLLGRWTTKLLLQEIIHRQLGRLLPLDSIAVLPGPDGAPRLSFTSAGSDLSPAFSVSISHSHGFSFCAVVTAPNWPLGADMELIEPRSPSFVADFFTAEEQEQVRESAPAVREALVTAVWSGKEAALKAVRQGLRSDTRSVSCHFAGGIAAGLPGSEADSLIRANGGIAGAAPWQSFAIRWQRAAAGAHHPPLKGWWMVRGSHVLTLAAQV